MNIANKTMFHVKLFFKKSIHSISFPLLLKLRKKYGYTFKKNKNSDDYVIALRKDDFKNYLSFFDSKVDFLADYIITKYKINFNNNINKNNIMILYSMIYDTGGHTEFALRFIDIMKDEHSITNFILGITGYSCGENCSYFAPIKYKKMSDTCDTIDVSMIRNLDEKLINFFNTLIEKNIGTIFVNIHPDDYFGALLLKVVKKSNIKVIYINHADQCPFIAGINYSDVIITRKINNHSISKNVDENIPTEEFLFLERDIDSYRKYDEVELYDFKKSLNIDENAVVSITACPFGKIKSENNNYLNLIKKLLIENKNLFHILIGINEENNIRFIKNYINDDSIMERLKVLPSTTEFDKYLQISDIFIDSFPQGVALTLLDCMRNRVVPIVKVNSVEPVLSFQMYMPENYVYNCFTEEMMYKIITNICQNKNIINDIAKENYAYYKHKYDINSVKSQYKRLIYE